MFRKSFFLVVALLLLIPAAVFGADKLIVQDSTSTTKFVVQDSGFTGFAMAAPLYLGDFSGGSVSKSQLHFSLTGVDTGGYISSLSPNNFWLSSGAAYDASAGGWIAKTPSAVLAGSGNAGYRIFLASGCTVGTSTCAGFSTPKFTLDYSGNLLISGALTQGSTRESKDNIQKLSSQSANEAFKKLAPVTYTYKLDPGQNHVGFIAEDVPELVAMKDRKSISPMDVVGVLTKVLQDKSQTIDKQQQTLDLMAAKLEKMEAEIKWLKSKDYTAQK
jgi:hypothetical protein